MKHDSNWSALRPFPSLKCFQNLKWSFSLMEIKASCPLLYEFPIASSRSWRLLSQQLKIVQNHSSQPQGPNLCPWTCRPSFRLSHCYWWELFMLNTEQNVFCSVFQPDDPAWGETVTALLKHPVVQGALLVLLMRALPVSVMNSHFQSGCTSLHSEAAHAL